MQYRKRTCQGIITYLTWFFISNFFSQEDVLWSAPAKQIKKESVTVVYAQLPKLQQ